MSSTVPKGFLLGLAVTAVIQSSSATTVMVVGFVNSGIMTLKQAVGVIMGSNVGTTVTAWILSLSGLEGDSLLVKLFKPTTLAPLLGTIGIGLFFPWEFLKNTAQPWNIAVIHTCFNLGATAVLLPMNKLLVKLAYLIVPEAKEAEKTALLDERLLATPAVAAQRAYEVAGQMARKVQASVDRAMGLTEKFDTKVMDQVIALEDETDRYEDALGAYLVKLSALQLSVQDNRSLNTLLYAIGDLERIADHAVGIAKAGELSESAVFSQRYAQYKAKYAFPEEK